eukprot:CAMPEP_0114611670 /NCGR_PEP_ID=MMETSP0168-20121206/4236_1 /TAXON_ID=95228 ORGANISM="Vannella sp., Strain DIVA3 517/6/12" /NCGR_SAMPLE_ID=MMETSP0168 /ASSEMBLY_ACC=CAM_ASM_000044 /LENGTH=170 /DNA_ID=CAMNT_0001822651 /DNA_START=62 /DNA_END=574 /DNA_ORIENTATION=-
MIITKKDRVAICKYLFEEGVLVAKKDYTINHPKIEPAVKNLHACKLMQSFKSKGYVNETFSWQYYYYYLTDEGIQFLRDFLHLGEEVVPNTLKKPRTASRAPGMGGRGKFGGDRGDRGDRPRFGGDKKGGAPSDFKPSFGGRGGDRWNRDKEGGSRPRFGGRGAAPSGGQ